jgi:hypothetical protein
VVGSGDDNDEEQIIGGGSKDEVAVEVDRPDEGVERIQILFSDTFAHEWAVVVQLQIDQRGQERRERDRTRDLIHTDATPIAMPGSAGSFHITLSTLDDSIAFPSLWIDFILMMEDDSRVREGCVRKSGEDEQEECESECSHDP